MGDAQKVFDEMPERNVVVWILMIRGFCDSGNVERGLSLFKEMRERSVVSWNSMISSLSKCGRDREALELFCEMIEQGFGVLDTGKWIHSTAESKGLIKDFITVVDFYCKSGDLETATAIFRQMQKKNVVSWNTMISGSAVNGNGEFGIDLFDAMIEEGEVSPNETTFVGVLACCSYTGQVEKGEELFGLMMDKFKLEPRTEHYGAMVDLMSGSGRIREAFEFLKSIPVNANASIWGLLLSACRRYDCTISLFGEVWGIGPATALKLYDSLTHAQRLGLKYFDDIPRHEV